MKIYRKLKLEIVGHGFVGKATDWDLIEGK